MVQCTWGSRTESERAKERARESERARAGVGEEEEKEEEEEEEEERGGRERGMPRTLICFILLLASSSLIPDCAHLSGWYLNASLETQDGINISSAC